MKQKSDAFEWRIELHVCRICFGRVTSRETFDGRRLFRCSNCGVEREGSSASAICACGIKLKSKIDAGIRCVVNEQRTPESPSEIVARQAAPVV
jgi:hypothetical protein